MQVDFVRVPAEVVGRCHGCVHFNPAEPRMDNCNTVNGVKQVDDNTCFGDDISYIWKAAPKELAPVTCKVSAHKAEYRARSNDPATSKGKRKVNKYEQAVLGCLAAMSVVPMYNGATGRQIAKFTAHPLNCITPRFAPLRRKGLIKDSGVRRDKQIVWCLA